MDKKMLMATPYPVLVIMLLYLWFGLKSGPEFMKRRAPLQFVPVLIAHNALQVLLSTYIIKTGVESLYQTGVISKTCYVEGHESIKPLIKHNFYIYILLKLCALLDTVFFVLKKKRNKITHLHVWHHTTSAMWAWYVGKYHETDSPVFLNTINSLAHVIVYGYYGLSLFPSMKKFLWWKKHITAVQMVELNAMAIYAITYPLVSDCKPDFIYISVICCNNLLVLQFYRFFYMNIYEMKKSKKM